MWFLVTLGNVPEIRECRCSFLQLFLGKVNSSQLEDSTGVTADGMLGYSILPLPFALLGMTFDVFGIAVTHLKVGSWCTAENRNGKRHAILPFHAFNLIYVALSFYLHLPHDIQNINGRLASLCVSVTCLEI